MFPNFQKTKNYKKYMNQNTFIESKYCIIADHSRAICFIISDGVFPNAKGRGYILRRLIRRCFSASLFLKIDVCEAYFQELVDSVIGIYSGVYDEIEQNKSQIIQILLEEWQKYQKTIQIGQKEWAKILG